MLGKVLGVRRPSARKPQKQAVLAEREELDRTQEVAGSSPASSIKPPQTAVFCRKQLMANIQALGPQMYSDAPRNAFGSTAALLEEAEGVGVELTIRGMTDNGFRDRPQILVVISRTRWRSSCSSADSGMGLSGVNRTVPFDKSNPASDPRAASIASGLNGKTLRWFLLALTPSSGRFLYLNAGVP
jgi:hypothetical protein